MSTSPTRQDPSAAAANDERSSTPAGSNPTGTEPTKYIGRPHTVEESDDTEDR
jgi:hypothetical protein